MVALGRPGRSRLGCLTGILALAATVYFGSHLGEVYLRYYQFRDAMRQEARFASGLSNGEIAAHLRAKADSLGLPSGAADVRVQRTRATITISTAYRETVHFRYVSRVLSFAPRVERQF